MWTTAGHRSSPGLHQIYPLDTVALSLSEHVVAASRGKGRALT